VLGVKSEVLFLTLYSLRFTIYGLEGRVRLAGVFSGLDKVESFGIILSYTFGGKIYEKKM